jgi:hypothetical protein
MAHNGEQNRAETTGLLWFRGGLRLEDNTCVYCLLLPLAVGREIGAE